MSETEFWTGIARIVKPKEGEDLEAQCKRICEENNEEMTSYHDSYKELLSDELSKKFVVAHGAVYDISQMNNHEDGFACEASNVDDETVSLTLMYYNGGTCFSEMFEDAIAKLNKKAA